MGAVVFNRVGLIPLQTNIYPTAYRLGWSGVARVCDRQTDKTDIWTNTLTDRLTDRVTD